MPSRQQQQSLPQRKSGYCAELRKGKAGRVAPSVRHAYVMKGLPLAYNRILQEDRKDFRQWTRLYPV
jgi:argininosuccinate lyase